MTPRSTLATGLRLDKVDRNKPSAKCYGIPNMSRVICRVSVMTSPAGSTFLLIDMDEVKVLIPISEPRHCCCLFVTGKRLFMAHKTQLIIINIVRGIKYRRERLSQ